MSFPVLISFCLQRDIMRTTSLSVMCLQLGSCTWLKSTPALNQACFEVVQGMDFYAKSSPNNHIGEINHILLCNEIYIVLIPLQDFKATSLLLMALNPLVSF